MEQLKISVFNEMPSSKVLKVTGWTVEELSYLNSLLYQDMKKAITELLNKRNNGYGTVLHNGYGIYDVWVHGEAVMVEVGKSCD